MATSSPGVRERSFTDFAATPPEPLAGHRHWLARAQNFWLEWVEVGGDAPFGVASDAEVLLIAPRGSLRVQPQDAHVAPARVPPHSVAILPAGRHTITGEPGAACVLIASQRDDLAGRRVLHQAAYEPPDARVLPAGQPWRRNRAAGIEVLDIDAVRASADKPRLKMLQTETLSINIVEYAGPRDRGALSPHAHAEFEQGSLAISGDFVHHLRVPWGSDADAWREDEHLAAPSPSLLVVPVHMVHTTEGVGPGHHLLLDIFSPPRADFIGSGWVFNAGDYSPQPAP
jgi:hypothetical protein